MSRMKRRTFIKGLGAAVTLAPGVYLGQGRSARAADAVSPHLTRINPDSLISPKEAHAWHVAKDSMGGPTLAGSPSWKNFLRVAEEELRKRGVVDIFRNPWTYTRWSTTEWPDDSNWSLHIDGEKVKVASYGCNSGKTPGEGVSGELVVYEEGMSAQELRGKIAIIVKPPARAIYDAADAGPDENPDRPAPSGGIVRTGDYEYLSSRESFPNPDVPRTEGGRLSPFRQMGLGRELEALREGGAIGALLVLGLSYDALAGTYTFGVPRLYDMPTLYIDVRTGAKIIEAAMAGKRARLRLIAQTEEAETYQLFGYLPGKNYGTARDEQILLITHTDGPSISQENGAFGILGIVDYFSKIPQADRPRTLMVFLDCRHYMPGAERAFSRQDYAASHPDHYRQVVAAMGIEHLGQMQVAERDGEPYHTTDKAELSTVWITNNQRLVDMAIKAVKDNNLQRVQVQCPGRPGIHGGQQGPWYGLGGIARRIGVPGSSTMGSMTAYWSSKARIEYLDADHFVDQVATMSQICGELMIADLQKIQTAEGSDNT
ncbi:hypothetical protein IIC65_03635 [Candidatus Sumerlaeota bacterium]|nr:hypothetical protein [Candidatus Sumerlaeota bacterium]